MDIFYKEGSKFDLLFSDVILPRENGFVLVDRIHSIRTDLPVIMASGYIEGEHQPQWLTAEENGFRFLQKPYPVVDMLRAVRESLDSAKHTVSAR